MVMPRDVVHLSDDQMDSLADRIVKRMAAYQPRPEGEGMEASVQAYGDSQPSTDDASKLGGEGNADANSPGPDVTAPKSAPPEPDDPSRQGSG